MLLKNPRNFESFLMNFYQRSPSVDKDHQVLTKDRFVGRTPKRGKSVGPRFSLEE